MFFSERSYLPGELIGNRFQVIHTRRGAFSNIFLCKDHQNDSYLALKTFRSDLFDEIQVQDTFFEEINIWLNLSGHPNIVECYGIEIINSRHFLAIEWIFDGKGLNCSLADYISKGPISIEKSLMYCIDVCSALERAQGVYTDFVHCDIHPGNILLDNKGDANLTDFGLSKTKSLLSSPMNTQKKIFDAGHVGYLAPERWQKKAYDQKSDIYSIGCVLYEMLVGKPLFEAESFAELKNKHLSSQRPKVNIQGDSQLAINSILEKCIALDSSERWESVTELKNVFEKIKKDYFPGFSTKSQIYTGLPEHISNLNKALSFFQLHDLDQALVYINAAIADNDSFALTYAYNALILDALGDVTGALENLDRAIELDDTNPLIYNNKGILLKKIGDYAKAILCYQKAIDLDENWEVPHVNLGNIYFLQDDFDKALVSYTKAIDINPNNGQLFLVRAKIRNQLGNNPEYVLRDLNDCTRLNPYIAEAYVLRGDLLTLAAAEKKHSLLSNLSKENLLHAIEEYSKALEMNDSIVDKGQNPGFKLDDPAKVFHSRGKAYKEYGDLSKALKDFDYAIDTYPDSHWLYFLYVDRSELYQTLGETELAKNDIEKSIEFETGVLNNWLSELTFRDIIEIVGRAKDFMSAGEYEKAIGEYSIIIEKSDPVSDVYTNRGVAYEKIGQYDKANEDFRKALELDPFDCDILVNLGYLCLRLEQFEDAAIFFKKASDLGDDEATYCLKNFDRLKNRRFVEHGQGSFSENIAGIVSELKNADTPEQFMRVVASRPLCCEPFFLNNLRDIIASQENKALGPHSEI